MFDIGWSELLFVAVILIVVVGPKDLPGMLRTFGRTTKQLRSIASDFRRQFDEAIEEAELDDVKKTVDDLRKHDPRKAVRDAVNPMKAVGDDIRSSLKSAGEAPKESARTASREPHVEEPAKGSTVPTAPADAAATEPAGSADPAAPAAREEQSSDADSVSDGETAADPSETDQGGPKREGVA